MNNSKLAMLVLSCDSYSDLWDDFFNLKEKYWSDCPYKWYIVTESKDYVRQNVEVIKCGKEFNWAGRFRYAVKQVNASFYGIYLEDYFITEKVDSKIITDLIAIMEEHHVTFINTADVFRNVIDMREKEYFLPHLIKIPNDRKYGISTESAIWEKYFLLSKIGEGDYSAWQFEIDRVKEAAGPEGLGGFNLTDDRMPFHVSTIPVVIQGKVYPDARKFFKKQGYIFVTSRANMPFKDVIIYKLKVRFSKIKYGKKVIKWFASKFLGIKFFT